MPRLSPEARQVAEAWDALRKAHPEADQISIKLWPKWNSNSLSVKLTAYYTTSGFHFAEGPDFPSAQAKLPGAFL